MDFSKLYFSLGMIGPFASRGFLTAFVAAMLMRFGSHVPFIDHSGIIAGLHHGAPNWLTQDSTLVVLGLLAAAEVFAQKSAELRLLLHEFDIYLKPALAGLVSMGYINASDAGLIQQFDHHAGFGDMLFPLMAALSTFNVAVLRKKVLGMVLGHVQGTKLGTWISWAEEIGVVFGVFLMFLWAALMVLAVAMSVAVLLIARKRFEVAEDHRRFACGGCGTLVYPCAVACGSCGWPVPQPVAIGFLGQSTLVPTADRANHPYRLMEKRRCPHCATRLPVGRPFDPCQCCGKSEMASAAFVEEYCNYVGRRLPVVLGVCFVVSLVPILGMVVGSVYYEMTLVLPYSQYLSMGRRFLLGWQIRLLFLVIVVLQVIPAVGSVAVPLMAWLSFMAHRHSYKTAMSTPPHQRGGTEGLPSGLQQAFPG